MPNAVIYTLMLTSFPFQRHTVCELATPPFPCLQSILVHICIHTLKKQDGLQKKVSQTLISEMRKSYGLPYSKLDVVKSMWASVHSIQTLIQFSAAMCYRQGILTVWSLVSHRELFLAWTRISMKPSKIMIHRWLVFYRKKLHNG